MKRKDKKSILEKSENLAKKSHNEFADLQLLSERLLRKMWLNKFDEIWDKCASND